MEISILFKIAAVGIITAILNMILKKSDKDDIATFVTLAGIIIVIVFVIDIIAELFDSLKNMLSIY